MEMWAASQLDLEQLVDGLWTQHSARDVGKNKEFMYFKVSEDSLKYVVTF